MALKSIMLMLLAILILVVPGMLYNNLNNNGLVVAQSTGLTCSSNAQTPTCQITGSVGCQASTNYCSLVNAGGQSGGTISFLNINSPFTQLVQGNIFGLFNSLTSSGSTAPSNNNPFQNTGVVPYYYVSCGVNTNGGRGLRNWALSLGCSQTNIDNGNLTYANTASWNNWNPTQNGSAAVAIHLFRFGNGSFPMTCSWNVQINYTAVAGNGWTYYGCTISQGTNIITHRQWPLLFAVSNSIGLIPNGYSRQYIYVQPENWYTQGCSGNGLTGNIHTDQCDAWSHSFLGFNIPGTSTSFVPSGGGAIIAFLIGVFLFLLGLGLSFSTSGSVFASGGGAGAGVNEQGTRLAQTLGIGLIVWAPLYSQFATWFTTGILPYGLDGTTGILSLILTGLFFFGVFWRALSRD